MARGEVDLVISCLLLEALQEEPGMAGQRSDYTASAPFLFAIDLSPNAWESPRRGRPAAPGLSVSRPLAGVTGSSPPRGRRGRRGRS